MHDIHTLIGAQSIAGPPHFRGGAAARREWTMPTRATCLAWRILRITAIATFFAGSASACSGAGSEAYGEPVDEAAAIPLKDLMKNLPAHRGDSLTVSGTIGTVCRSAGCWFTLRDLTGKEPVEIFVDLQAGATFTVPPRTEGKSAVLVGKLVGEEPDLAIHAVGLVVK